MHIFISPDRTQLPILPNSQACNNLEQITGADIAISSLSMPIPPTVDLSLHIKNRTSFIQIKIGYDVIGDFNQIWREIARMQACKIPMQQAIILTVGIYKPNKDGFLRVQGVNPIENNKTIKYETYLKNVAEWTYSGIQHCNINDISELETWINARVGELERIDNREGKKEVYPPRVEPVFEVDDIWQLVEEIDPCTMDYFLCAGAKGIGQSTLRSVRDYFKKELPHLPPSGHYMFSAMTDMENGKLKHNIPGWGIKRAQFLRNIWLLIDNANLVVNEKLTENEYLAGWTYALQEFKGLIDEGHSVKDAFNACVKMPKDFIPF